MSVLTAEVSRISADGRRYIFSLDALSPHRAADNLIVALKGGGARAQTYAVPTVGVGRVSAKKPSSPPDRRATSFRLTRVSVAAPPASGPVSLMSFMRIPPSSSLFVARTRCVRLADGLTFGKLHVVRED